MHKLATYLAREGPFATPDAVGWVVRLASALAVIHRVGVAYGRLSAKAVRIADGPCSALGFLVEGEGLTDELGYHSPERLAGGGPSPEDDTWAAGVVLYQLLTGAMPFPGDSEAQVRAEILASHAVPLARRGVTEPCLQQVINDLFAPERDGRLASLDQLHRRLVECVPQCEGLPPLKLGTPDDAPSVEIEEEAPHISKLPSGRPSRPKLSPAAAAIPRSKLTSKPPQIFDMEFEELAQAAKSDPGQILPDAGDIFGSVPPPKPSPSPPSGPAAAEGPSAEPPPLPPHQPEPAPPDRPPALAPLESALHSSIPAPPPRRGRLAWWLAGGALLLGAAAAALFVLTRGGEETSAGGSSVADTTLPSADTSAAPAAASAVPTPAASTAELSAPTAQASSAPSRRVPADLPTCMSALFPPDAFAEITPRFEFVCTETHARKGGTALKVEVIRTGGEQGKLPPAMQEWAKLGWYEMAVFAVARTRCCAEPAPLATPLGIDLCPLDKTLNELGQAAVEGDEQAVAQAIEAYTEVAQCLVRAGASKAFGQAVAPNKAATETFQAIVRRARAAE